MPALNSFVGSPGGVTEAAIPNTTFTLPEDHEDCYFALWCNRNINEYFDTGNNAVGLDKWYDTRNGFGFQKSSSTKYPRIFKSGATLNRLGSFLTIEFRGADSGAESILNGFGDDCLAWARNKVGLSFIAVIKLNATGAAQQIFVADKGGTGNDSFGLTVTSGNEFSLTARHGASGSPGAFQGTITSTGTAANTTNWVILSGACLYNVQYGAETGELFLRKNYAQIAAEQGVFATTLLSNSFDGGSTDLRFGANNAGTGSYGQFNMAAFIAYDDFLTQVEIAQEEVKVAQVLGLVTP